MLTFILNTEEDQYTLDVVEGEDNVLCQLPISHEDAKKLEAAGIEVV